MNLAFDIHLRTYPKGKTHFILEVTEDYEGDKWHVAVFQDGDYYDTKGFNNKVEILEYLKYVPGYLFFTFIIASGPNKPAVGWCKSS